MSTQPPAPKRTKISQSDIPGVPLEQALRVARVIADQYGKSPTRPIDIAAGLEMSPTAGAFRQLCGASLGYGLTDGGPNAAMVSLTELGKRVVAPLEEGDDLAALRRAVLTPTVVKGFLEKYDGSPVPEKRFALNVLQTMGVPANRSGAVFDLIIQNADHVGYLKRIKDKTYVDLGVSSASPMAATASDPIFDDDDEGDEELPAASNRDSLVNSQSEQRRQGDLPLRSNAIFLGHGTNKVPLDQLVKILNEYGIPHKQAIAEPNAGRPIPTKVADTMRECGAAILIFTADKKFHDEEGNEIWRPSENVVHELGAASVLYDNRIVIFKESSVSLASNFSSIGYIEFEKDKLSDKGIDLFRELVSFKIVSIKVGE